MKAVLFDLDGTLLSLRFDDLLKDYFMCIGQYFRRYLEPELFVKELMAATEKMIGDTDETTTNLEVFFHHFCLSTGLGEEMIPIFERFYTEEFPKLAPADAVNPQAREILELAVANGKKVVLATNPVFPEQAIIERLRWANLDDVSFDLVTHAENMHFCKPQTRYYQEIADILNVQPQECLMIGDDRENDGPASLIGMKVFLLTQGNTLSDAMKLVSTGIR